MTTKDAEIFGYSTEFSVLPGDVLEFFVSTNAPTFRARVVGLTNPPGPSPLGSWSSGGDLGSHAGVDQMTTLGSCVVIPNMPELPAGDFTLQIYAWPTLPADGRKQAIVTWGDIRLGLEGNGAVSVSTPSGAHMLGPTLQARQWYRLTFGWSTQPDECSLRVDPLSNWTSVGGRRVSTAQGPVLTSGLLLLGASSYSTEGPGAREFELSGVFNGKIANPWVASIRSASITSSLQAEVDAHGPHVLGDALIAAWDLARATDRVVRASGSAAPAGFTVNTPTSAVTGPFWTGQNLDYRQAPAEYNALHLHDDDLDDARWHPSLQLQIPDDAPSGLYGLRVDAMDATDVIPIAVRSATRDPGRGIFLLPTFSYLAYANQRWTPGEALALKCNTLRAVPARQPGDGILDAHPEVISGCYDRHRDGSPIVYSTRRRPIVDLRHDYRFRFTNRVRGFSADVEFLRWLSSRGHRLDVITDHDLHREGRSLISDTPVLVTGSHPEYVSDRMFAAIDEYCAAGGRLMYLGGNGFWYVACPDPVRPDILEMRRGPGGGNTNGDSPAGEAHLSSTGEPGGLWRCRGRSAHGVVGVGTVGMGWGRSRGYLPTSAASDPSVQFVFDGVDIDMPIGAGDDVDPLGAASDEVDATEILAGTPAHALIVASSAGRHDDRYVLIPDDLGSDRGSTAPVRAEMVYACNRRGGMVFSVGSMGWTAAAVRDPTVARVTLNVLRRFEARRSS